MSNTLFKDLVSDSLVAAVSSVINGTSYELEENYEQVAAATSTGEVKRGRGRPRKNPVATETPKIDDIEHVVTQLRKVVSLRGQKPVTFQDGRAYTIPENHARKALSIHDGLKTSEQKQIFATKLHKNVESFRNALTDAKPGVDHTPKKGVTLFVPGKQVAKAMSGNYED